MADPKKLMAKRMGKAAATDAAKPVGSAGIAALKKSGERLTKMKESTKPYVAPKNKSKGVAKPGHDTLTKKDHLRMDKFRKQYGGKPAPKERGR